MNVDALKVNHSQMERMGMGATATLLSAKICNVAHAALIML